MKGNFDKNRVNRHVLQGGSLEHWLSACIVVCSFKYEQGSAADPEARPEPSQARHAIETSKYGPGRHDNTALHVSPIFLGSETSNLGSLFPDRVVFERYSK